MKRWQAKAPAPRSGRNRGVGDRQQQQRAERQGAGGAQRHRRDQHGERKVVQALLRQREGAAHHSQDDRDDDLRGAGAVKVEGLKLPDTREQVGIGEIAEDVDVELRSVGIEQGRERRHDRRLEIPAVFQGEQQGDQGAKKKLAWTLAQRAVTTATTTRFGLRGKTASSRKIQLSTWGRASQ